VAQRAAGNEQLADPKATAADRPRIHENLGEVATRISAGAAWPAGMSAARRGHAGVPLGPPVAPPAKSDCSATQKTAEPGAHVVSDVLPDLTGTPIKPVVVNEILGRGMQGNRYASVRDILELLSRVNAVQNVSSQQLTAHAGVTVDDSHERQHSDCRAEADCEGRKKPRD
jgi:hypothetical protein